MRRACRWKVCWILRPTGSVEPPGRLSLGVLPAGTYVIAGGAEPTRAGTGPHHRSRHARELPRRPLLIDPEGLIPEGENADRKLQQRQSRRLGIGLPPESTAGRRSRRKPAANSGDELG